MPGILIGSDHGGFPLKNQLIQSLKQKGYNLMDRGCLSEASCDYPDFAQAVARDIQSGAASFGILICKSGIGMSMAANRFRGVRAALCGSSQAAALARQHNNANCLVLGSSFVSTEEAEKIAEVFLTTDFEGGRHVRRVEKMDTEGVE